MTDDWRSGQAKGERFRRGMALVCEDCDYYLEEGDVRGDNLRALAREHAQRHRHFVEVTWTRGIKYDGRQSDAPAGQTHPPLKPPRAQ